MCSLPVAPPVLLCFLSVCVLVDLTPLFLVANVPGCRFVALRSFAVDTVFAEREFWIADGALCVS